MNVAPMRPGLPEVPTLIENGFPGTVIDAWFGIAAPAATPAPIVGQLSAAVLEAINAPEAKPRFEKRFSPVSGIFI